MNTAEMKCYNSACKLYLFEQPFIGFNTEKILNPLLIPEKYS